MVGADLPYTPELLAKVTDVICNFVLSKAGLFLVDTARDRHCIDMAVYTAASSAAMPPSGRPARPASPRRSWSCRRGTST